MGGGGGASGGKPGAQVQDVDQVEAVRDWLRQRGVDPGEVAGPGRTGAGAAAHSTREASGDPWAAVVVGVDGAHPEEGGPGRSDRLSGRAGRKRRRSGGDAEGAPATVSSADPRGADPDADPEELARRIVVNKLAVQARTRTELERALARREVPKEAAAAVLDRMGEIGLIDDATFARDWVASRQQRRHLSRTALRRELQTKGVDRDLIDDALADVAPDDEHGAALDLARRRATTMGGLSREVAYRRLGGVLARRGFAGPVVARVLDEVLAGHGD